MPVPERSGRIRRLWAVILFTLLAAGGPAASAAEATSVAAVLSSEIGPYQEALKGLQGEMPDVSAFFLTRGEPEIPASARVIVLFGSKAAIREYPDGAVLVYAMASGVMLRTKRSVKISMLPEHRTLLSDLRIIQPELKRLGILWVSPHFKTYASELSEAAKAFGISIESSQMDDESDLPEHLRRLYGKVDAIWLVPDPLLVNPKGLPVFIEFSHANRVPLFVPTGGLTDQGATAAVGPTFREMGRLAAAAAKKALKDEAQESTIYSSNVEIIINKTAAAQVGLKIPKEALRNAHQVLP